MRLQAAPLLFFVAPERGAVEFRGFGLIENVELVAQIEPETGEAFSNYAFDCALLNLATEGEQFDWRWIAARKDPAQSLQATLDLAPSSWKDWVSNGSEAVSRSRRVVARMGITRREEQLPPPGSPEEHVLKEVYDFYSADGLKRNKLLRKITLDCNNLKQSGARALVKASLGVPLKIVVACLVCLDMFVNVLSRLLTRLFVLAN